MRFFLCPIYEGLPGMKLALLALAGLLRLTSGACAQDKHFYIYLCFGQSNMDGYP
jgi:hypothetical protein